MIVQKYFYHKIFCFFFLDILPRQIGTSIQLTGTINVRDYADCMRVNNIINQDYCIKELQQLLRDMTAKHALTVTHDVFKPHQCKTFIFNYSPDRTFKNN